MKQGIFLVVLLFLISGCSLTADVVKEELMPRENTTEPKIYFCPRDDCNKALFDFLASANSTIHCAFFDLDLKEIVDLLNEKSKTIDVKVVVDNQYFDELKQYSFIRKDTSKQYMHNKFCVVDSRKVFTGSFNPTYNDAYKNNNNALFIDSIYLAKNYEDEFSELWNDIFGAGRKTENKIIYLNDKEYESYFCPEDGCAEKIEAVLKKANNSIFFMAFSFTHPGIATTIAIKLSENISVKGIFEKRTVSNYSSYVFLAYQGADLAADTNPYSMHHKVFIIDNKTVITGSFNPSKNADERNDENILIIHDSEIAGKYAEEFRYLWKH